MWKQFIDKWKQWFQQEEEHPMDENRFDEKKHPTYHNTEARSKITYHYPKTGSFRFPVIPDDSTQSEPRRPRRRSERQKDDTSEENVQEASQYPSPRKKEEENHAAEKRRETHRPTPSEEPFKPTVVPSPVYGFRSPLSLEVGKEEEPPETEVPPAVEEEIPEEREPFTEEIEEQGPMEETGDLSEEIALEEMEKEPLLETYDPLPEEPEEETSEREVPVGEEEPAEGVEEGPVPGDGRAREEGTEEAQTLPAAEVQEEQNNTIYERPGEEEESHPEEKEAASGAGRREEHKRTSVPFNVIMTPRDKNSRRKARSRGESVDEPREKRGKTPAETEGETVGKDYEIPLHLFNDKVVQEEDEDHLLREQMNQLENTLQQFQVKAKVTDAMKGPAVTRFEVQPEPGVKVSKITKLSDDIKLGMAARDIRMEAPIPGKQAVGIEVPNQKSQIVGLQEIFETEAFRSESSPLTVGLGLDIAGTPSVTNLKDMPHGLIAGATGSGKSVCINTILLSLIYKSHYDDVKFLLIDPKMVELAPYNDLPQLVSPVITDVKAATTALKWAVQEMEERYEKFVEYGVRDVEKFNEKVKRDGKPEEKLPYLVIVIDELADLMMTSPQDVEDAICKIAQKARACGIHLLVATQRPSVDVITGLIKANIPTRIAFSVSSQADSRTVLDSGGAEKLLGKGDMLFIGNGDRTPKRIQGAFVSDEEIMRVTNYMKKVAPSQYLFEQEELLKQVNEEEAVDDLFDEAVAFVIQQNGASASLIQRRFRVGYNRAARLIDQMEQYGIISEQKGSKPRDVLWTSQQLDEWRHGETS